MLPYTVTRFPAASMPIPNTALWKPESSIPFWNAS